MYVVNESDVVEDRVIEPGLRNWVWTEVREGLEPGATLILNVDRDGVEEGATVTPIRPSAVDD